ncbi:hypothetical protein [Micromonospora sp. NPDC048843]|uniref:hypothetical protein n=1 Tax=Micromonospora sp. NPDC048843 TaxID=3155389 RepID=UPI003407D643
MQPRLAPDETVLFTQRGYFPPWRIWALALAAMGIMRTALVLLLLLGTGLYLLRTVVGVSRYYAWVNRRAKGRRSASRRG